MKRDLVKMIARMVDLVTEQLMHVNDPKLRAAYRLSKDLKTALVDYLESDPC